MTNLNAAGLRCAIGYTPKGAMHFVEAGNPDRGLCGTRLECVPFVRPADPFVHGACQDALAAFLAGAGPAPVMFAPVAGECPDCGGSVDVDEHGLVAAHLEAIIRRGVVGRSNQSCAGQGRPAEVLT